MINNDGNETRWRIFILLEKEFTCSVGASMHWINVAPVTECSLISSAILPEQFRLFNNHSLLFSLIAMEPRSFAAHCKNNVGYFVRNRRFLRINCSISERCKSFISFRSSLLPHSTKYENRSLINPSLQDRSRNCRLHKQSAITFHCCAFFCNTVKNIFQLVIISIQKFKNS